MTDLYLNRSPTEHFSISEICLVIIRVVGSASEIPFSKCN